MAEDINRERCEWAKLLYDNLLKDIKFTKDRQLKLVYYTVLTNTGLFIIVRKIKFDCIIIFVALIYFVISFIACNFIRKIEEDIDRSRRYIETLRDNNPIIRILLNEERQYMIPQSEYLKLYYAIVILSAILFSLLKLING